MRLRRFIFTYWTVDGDIGGRLMSKDLEHYIDILREDDYAASRARIICSFIPKSFSEKNILDIGCGLGFTLAMLKEQGFKNIYGIDIIHKALKGAQDAGLKNLIQSDIENGFIPCKRGFFDLVICTEVFEHLFDPVSVLEKIKIVLKKGGVAVLSFYNEYRITQRISFLLGRCISDPLITGGHIKFFNKTAIETMLQNAGFRIIEFKPIPGPKISRYLPMPRMIARLLPNLFATTFFVKAIYI